MDIANVTKEGNGKATLKTKTTAGGNLTFSMKGKNVAVTDEQGGMTCVTIKDVN